MSLTLTPSLVCSGTHGLRASATPPRPSAETVLRDLAFVLHLTKRVKEEMSAQGGER